MCSSKTSQHYTFKECLPLQLETNKGSRVYCQQLVGGELQLINEDVFVAASSVFLFHRTWVREEKLECFQCTDKTAMTVGSLVTTQLSLSPPIQTP